MTSRFLGRLTGATGSLALLGAGIATVSAPQQARASDWGCQVILCLATPGSPMKYAQCVPPILKLWRSLSFPTCSEGGVATATRKIKDGYVLQVVNPDGSASSYTVNTKYQTVTNNNPTVGATAP